VHVTASVTLSETVVDAVLSAAGRPAASAASCRCWLNCLR
jgi:hypothetical protein